MVYFMTVIMCMMRGKETLNGCLIRTLIDY